MGAVNNKRTPHRKTHAQEYGIWCTMLTRCYNPNSEKYPRYGGRGIFVCEAWRTSFETFLTDMGPRPSKKHSLERVNNDQGYSPENTIWATQYEQSRNMRTNVLITYNGETLILGDWAARVGLKRHTLAARLRLGWSLERALTTPADYGNKRKL